MNTDSLLKMEEYVLWIVYCLSSALSRKLASKDHQESNFLNLNTWVKNQTELQ